MPKKQRTWFYKWIAKDDYVTTDATYLYWDNIDSSIFGYWATISRKSSKLIETSHPIYDIGGNLESNNDSNKVIVGHDGTNGYIYKFNSADSTPEVTVSPTDTTYNLLSSIAFNTYYYFMGHNPLETDRSAMHHATNSALTMNYDTFTDANFGSNYIMKNITAKSVTMIAGQSRVWTIPSSSTVVTERKIFTWEVTGVEEVGTQILVYTDRSRVYIWDGVSGSVNGSKKLWYNSLKTWISWDSVFSTTDKGSIVEGNWYSFGEIYKSRKTRKAEDSSAYYDILDYSSPIDDKTQGNSIDSVNWETYFIEWWKRISKLAYVRPWVPKGMSTVLSKNYDNVTIDKIYCIKASRGCVYFSYKAWSYYWVDKIDCDSLDSHQSGTIITQIFRGVPDTESKIKRIKLTYSNTSWNKGISLYKRINWWSWVLIRDYNESDDKIRRAKITNQTDQFVDIQFKVVLTNTDQDDTPPILHDLSLEYSVIED